MSRQPLNECGVCGEDFTSLECFDRHRVGVHEYAFAEGMAMEPPRDDGRRCLDAAEMVERGWQPDSQGRWFDPVRSARAARAFRPSSGRAP